jgi:hypothetical protein
MLVIRNASYLHQLGTLGNFVENSKNEAALT